MVTATDSNVSSAFVFSDSITVIRSILETSTHLASGDSDDLALSLNLTLRALGEVTAIENEIKSIALKLSNDTLYAAYDGGLSLGDRIQLARENLGLNHLQLADMVSVTRSCIDAWEDGTTIPAANMIMPLASALKCDPLWLLTGNNPEITQ